jgi:hypothetical protein
LARQEWGNLETVDNASRNMIGTASWATVVGCVVPVKTVEHQASKAVAL